MMTFRTTGRTLFLLPILLSILLTACSGSGTAITGQNTPPSSGGTSGGTPPPPGAFNLSTSVSSGSTTGSISPSPAGTSCGTNCYTYTSGTSVTLTASAASGYNFSGWNGSGISCPGTGPCTVSMTAGRSVSATFAPPPPPGAFNLSTSVSSGSTTGSISPSPVGTSCGTNCYTYTSGTSVTLTATAASGYNFSGWNGSGISCSGTGPCTVSMTAGRSVSATFAMPGATTGAPAILFSDLDSGPSTGGQDNQGVFVTIWGKNFGATPGSITVGGGQVASIVSWTQGSGSYAAWSMDKVVFQLGSQAATGNIVLTNTNGTSNGIPFTVRAGNIYFVTPNGTGNGNYATPMSPSAAYTVMGPGKTFYFRGGTYNQGYSPVGGYTDRNYALDQAHGGSAGLPMAMVGYPNETAVFEALNASRNNFAFGTGGAPASYVTLANFTLHGGSTCIEDGGFWTNAKSGGVGSRIIGNVLSASYGGANTMAGLIMIQNDYWRVLGNEIKDTGTGAPINNNHAIYNQSGASETEIAWNYFHNLRMGHVIQVHTDNYYTYSNVRIHDNVIAKGTNGDSRAINVGTANGDSYGSIYNNIMDGVGSNFSAIAIWSGSWKIFNNTMYNIYTPGSSMVFVTNSAYVNFAAPASWLPAPVVELENNIFYSDGSSPYISLSTSNPAPIVTVNHNLYFNYGAAPSQDTAPRTGNPLFANAAAGDFRLQNSSPAVNTGIATTVVTIDHDGVGRPQGGVVDVGAYEQ